jgi:hypothetical protein
MSEEEKVAHQGHFDAAASEFVVEKKTSEPYANSEAGTTHLHEITREEKRLLFKLDRVIVPLTSLLYLSAYLDRSVTFSYYGERLTVE